MRLKDHSFKLNDHDVKLNDHVTKLNNHGVKLNVHSVKLDDHRYNYATYALSSRFGVLDIQYLEIETLFCSQTVKLPKGLRV